MALYWEATFCLQPGGDTISRKAIVDALLLGCIPVLFFKSTLTQWPWHWGEWVLNASVFIDHQEIEDNRTDPVAHLASLPPERVRAMQRTLALHAHTLAYGLGPRGLPGDAIERLVSLIAAAPNNSNGHA